jgi:hypothetical protein
MKNIAESLERIAICLEKMVEMQTKQIAEAQNAPQRIAEITEQLKKAMGGNHGN